MESKRIDLERDYEVLVGWWTKWGFPCPPAHFLPPLGVMIYNEGYPVAAGFFYRSDSKIGWLEWIVGNPDVSKDVRGAGLVELFRAVKVIATTLDFTAVFTSSKSASLNEKLEAHFGRKTDEGMTHFVWRG